MKLKKLGREILDSKRKIVYLGFFLPLLILLGHCSYYLGWIIDDPYISYRYAENLASGFGLVFNPGERVEGYSNFLFTVLLAGFKWLGLSPVAVSPLLGFLSVLILLLILFITLQGDIFKNPGSRLQSSEFSLVWSFPLYLLALNGSVALWSVSGMETGVYTFLVTLAWVAIIMEEDNRCSPYIVGGAFLIVAISRPEGVLFFIISCLADLLRALFKMHRSITKTLLKRTLPFILLYGGYNLWRISYYHSLLPNPFYAKATGELGERITAGLIYISQFIINNGSVLFLLVLFPILKSPISNSPIRRSLEFIFAGLIFNIYCGGDWMPLWRFITPILPMIFYLKGRGLAALWQHLRKFDPKFYRRGFTLLTIILALSLSLVQELKLTLPLMESVSAAPFYHPNVFAGEWLKKNAPTKAKVAGEEAGIIPYYSQLYFIDMIGIVDPYISRLSGGLHQKFDAQYVLDKRPDYIVLICKANEENAGSELMRLPDQQKIEARFPSGQQIMENPAFIKNYKPVVKFLRGSERRGFHQLVIFNRESKAP